MSSRTQNGAVRHIQPWKEPFFSLFLFADYIERYTLKSKKTPRKSNSQSVLITLYSELTNLKDDDERKTSHKANGICIVRLAKEPGERSSREHPCSWHRRWNDICFIPWPCCWAAARNCAFMLASSERWWSENCLLWNLGLWLPQAVNTVPWFSPFVSPFDLTLNTTC